MVDDDLAGLWLAVLDEVHQLPAVAVAANLDAENLHLDGNGPAGLAFFGRELRHAALDLAAQRPFRLVA